jgi:hypothetical protein
MRTYLSLGALLLAAALVLAGCGNHQDCALTALTVAPPSASADHIAAAPGNQIQFFAGASSSKGCALAACMNCWGQTWSVSDPVNVSISNGVNDNGTATCLGTTNGPVTITATTQVAGKSAHTLTATSTLTCR